MMDLEKVDKIKNLQNLMYLERIQTKIINKPLYGQD